MIHALTLCRCSEQSGTSKPRNVRFLGADVPIATSICLLPIVFVRRHQGLQTQLFLRYVDASIRRYPLGAASTRRMLHLGPTRSRFHFVCLFNSSIAPLWLVSRRCILP